MPDTATPITAIILAQVTRTRSRRRPMRTAGRLDERIQGSNPTCPSIRDIGNAMSDLAREMAAGLRTLLKTERVRRRVSQADLAAKVGRSRKWLSDFERGVIDPAFVTLFALAIELNVKIEYSAAENIENS